MFSRLTSLGLRFGQIGTVYKRSFGPTYASNNIKSNFSKRFKRFERFNSTAAPEKKQKGLKALIQEYGYSALAVYLGLSLIDYPLCFLGVHSIGVDQVREYEEKVKNKLKELVGMKPSERKPVDTVKEKEDETSDEKKSFWDSPLIVEAVVAYALHKSLIFIRVPITAAVTPSVVGQLRRWGFNIGKQKLSTIAQQAKLKTTQAVVRRTEASSLNTKFGTSPTKKQKWWSWFF